MVLLLFCQHRQNSDSPGHSGEGWTGVSVVEAEAVFQKAPEMPASAVVSINQERLGSSPKEPRTDLTGNHQEPQPLAFPIHLIGNRFASALFGAALIGVDTDGGENHGRDNHNRNMHFNHAPSDSDYTRVNCAFSRQSFVSGPHALRKTYTQLTQNAKKRMESSIAQSVPSGTIRLYKTPPLLKSAPSTIHTNARQRKASKCNSPICRKKPASTKRKIFLFYEIHT